MTSMKGYALLVAVVLIGYASAYAPLDNCTVAAQNIDATQTGAAQFASVNWVNEPNQCYLLCKMNYGLFGNMGSAPCKGYAFSYSVPLYSTTKDLCYIYSQIPSPSTISANGTYTLYTC